MSNKLDKSNEVILDVFEIEDYDNPVIRYGHL